MFGHWDRLGPRLPFETPGSLPRADSLGVSSSAWFQPERIRIERPPIIIDSILRLISNGNGVEESADMISPGEVDRRRAQSARLVLQRWPRPGRKGRSHCGSRESGRAFETSRRRGYTCAKNNEYWPTRRAPVDRRICAGPPVRPGCKARYSRKTDAIGRSRRLPTY